MPTKKPTLTAADLDALHALIADAAERRVWGRVWKLAATAAWAVSLLVFGWWLNNRGIQRNDETRHEHRQEAARVEAKLQQVEAVTKAFAPEQFTSK